MLKLEENCVIKLTFDSTQSMSVSTHKLNEKGFGGSAVDIWSNIHSREMGSSAFSASFASFASSASGGSQLDAFDPDKLQFGKINSSSVRSMSPASPDPASPQIHVHSPVEPPQMKNLSNGIGSIVELMENGENLEYEIPTVKNRTFVGSEGEDSIDENDNELSQSSQANTTQPFTTPHQRTVSAHNGDNDNDNDHEADVEIGYNTNADHDDDQKTDIIYEEETPGKLFKKKKSVPL